MGLEEVQEIHQLVVVQAVMAEVEHAFHRSGRDVFHHPFQILQLQVGNADMLDDAFLAQAYKRGERLAGHLVEVRELDVMDIDQVDIVDVQTIHALVHAAGHTFGGIVPGVVPVLAIAAHFRGQEKLVPRDVLQGFPEDGFGFVIAVIRGYVDEVDAGVDGCENGIDALRLLEIVEDAAQGGGAETNDGHLHPGLSQIAINHRVGCTRIQRGSGIPFRGFRANAASHPPLLPV